MCLYTHLYSTIFGLVVRARITYCETGDQETDECSKNDGAMVQYDHDVGSFKSRHCSLPRSYNLCVKLYRFKSMKNEIEALDGIFFRQRNVLVQWQARLPHYQEGANSSLFGSRQSLQRVLVLLISTIIKWNKRTLNLDRSVSILPFFSDDPSSNPAKDHRFYSVKWKERKWYRMGHLKITK